LAGLLVPEPDFIICDEPTNFLDLRTQMYLERLLAELRIGVLIVSHDLAFLDATCQTTADLQAGQLTTAPMGPQRWLEEKAERREHLRRSNAGIAAKRAQLEQFVLSNKANANTASQARSKAKQLERQNLHTIEEDDEARGHIRLPPLAPRDGPAIVCDNLVVGYGDKPIADAGDLVIDRGEHVVILGDNGQGKTTFLRTICGDLAPVQGSFRLTHQESIGVYAQHVHSSLPEDHTVHSYLRGLHPGSDNQSILAAAGGFGFHDLELEKSIAVLSGGERARLALAGLFLGGATILLLDEPTNHLDIATVAGLTAAIQETNATVLVITHDRRLATAIGDSILAVGNGIVQRDTNGVEGWLRSARQAAQQPATKSPAPTAPDQSAVSAATGTVNTLTGSERYQAQKEMAKLEKTVAKQRARLLALDDELAICTETDVLTTKNEERHALAAAIDQSEERQLELMELLEGS
jgi:ATP-binding cassette subfamily F protein 3